MELLVERRRGEDPHETEVAAGVNDTAVQAGNALPINTAHFGGAPAGWIQSQRIVRGELEGNRARHGEGFLAFGQFLLEAFIQIVVIRMEGMQEWVERMIVRQQPGALQRARSKRPPIQGQRLLKGEEPKIGKKTG